MADAYTPADLRDWIKGILGTQGITYSYGVWVDRPDIAGNHIVAIVDEGGAEPLTDLRRIRQRVLLLGPVNGRGTVMTIRGYADSLIAAAWSDSPPACTAGIIPTGEAIGPGYTTEDRPWFSVSFEITF